MGLGRSASVLMHTSTVLALALEQEQVDKCVKPIVYISRATIPAERNWTALDLEAGGVIWALKRLRGYLWSTNFEIYTDHQALTSIIKVGEHNAHVQRWLECVCDFSYKVIYRRAPPMGTPTSFPACRSLPRPPTLVVQTALVT